MSGPPPRGVHGPGDPPMPPRRLGPVSFGDLFEITPRVFRRELRVFLAVAAAFLLPVYLVLGVAQAPFVAALTSLSTTEPPSRETIERLAEPFLAFVGAGLLAGFVAYIGSAALVRVAARTYIDGRASFADAATVAVRRTPSLLAASIVSTLAVVGLIVLAVAAIVLVFMALAGSGSPSEGGPAAFLAILVGVVVVIALVALAIRWVLAPQAIVIEGVGGVGGLGRSWRLTAGAMWRTLGALVIFGLIVAVIQALVSQILFVAIGASATDPSRPEWAVASAAVSAVATIPFAPVMPIVLTVLYFDQRVRREEFDVSPGQPAGG